MAGISAGPGVVPAQAGPATPCPGRVARGCYIG